MPPATPKPSPCGKPPQRPLPRSCSSCVAGSASQPRYWPTKVRRSCPGPWQTSVASCRSNSSAPPCTTRRPMGWWKDSTRPWNGCSVEWPRRIGATGTGCSRMFCSESGRYPKRPPASPHLNSSSDVSLADYSTSPRRPGSNSRPPSVHHRTRPGNEGTDRQSYAHGSGTPHTSATGPTTPL